MPLIQELNAAQSLRNSPLCIHDPALAAAQTQAEHLLLTSLDEAVNPTSAIGATKRAAEMVISAVSCEHAGTKFLALRLGNVLGSSASAIPNFKEQIATSGRVTATDPDITHYFMTIPEAGRPVLQAGAIGEHEQVLDMGEPMMIVGLARALIGFAGHTNDKVLIEFTGLRAGEELSEELLADGDTTLPTEVDRLSLAPLQPQTCGLDVLNWVQKMALETGAEQGARLHPRAHAPEFGEAALAP